MVSSESPLKKVMLRRRKQPSAHAGVAWAPGEHLSLGLGGSGAIRQRNQSVEDRVGLLGTLEGSAGWTF